MPIAAVSASQSGPVPPPEHTDRIVRPPEMTSSDAHSYANTRGSRSANEPMQLGPSRTRLVRPASAASKVSASSRR